MRPRANTVRDRPRAADLGLNGVLLRLVVLDLVLLAVTVPLYAVQGLSVDLSNDAWVLPLTEAGVGTVVWGYYFLQPGRRSEWLNAEISAAFLLLLLLAIVMAPAQYLAASLDRPLVDPALAAIDDGLGVDPLAIAAWMRRHPFVTTVMVFAYRSLYVQFTLIFAALWVAGDRRRVWEYAFVFHACVIVSVLSSAVFPAVSPFGFYGFDSPLQTARVTAHFAGVRSGTLTAIPFGQIEGLVTMPSFHAAGAMALTWAVRGRRLILLPVAVLNGLLILATIMTGVHYVADLLGAALLVGGSVLVYRRCEERWLFGATSSARSGRGAVEDQPIAAGLGFERARG